MATHVHMEMPCGRAGIAAQEAARTGTALGFTAQSTGCCLPALKQVGVKHPPLCPAGHVGDLSICPVLQAHKSMKRCKKALLTASDFSFSGHSTLSLCPANGPSEMSELW